MILSTPVFPCERYAAIGKNRNDYSEQHLYPCTLHALSTSMILPTVKSVWRNWKDDMTITLEQAKALKHGQVLHEPHHNNADGTPRRWRVNGKVKTWVRSPERVSIPIKYGLYTCDYLTQSDLWMVCLTAEDAIAQRERKEQEQDV